VIIFNTEIPLTPRNRRNSWKVTFKTELGYPLSCLVEFLFFSFLFFLFPFFTLFISFYLTFFFLLIFLSPYFIFLFSLQLSGFYSFFRFLFFFFNIMQMHYICISLFFHDLKQWLLFQFSCKEQVSTASKVHAPYNCEHTHIYMVHSNMHIHWNPQSAPLSERHGTWHIFRQLWPNKYLSMGNVQVRNSISSLHWQIFRF